MDLATVIMEWIKAEEWIPQDALERLKDRINAAKANPPTN